MAASKLLYDYAMQLTKVPYLWGGSNPMGFDCSGLVQELLASQGLDPQGDQTAQGLYNYFKKNGTVGVFGLGALAFYGASTSQITHITMMLDEKLCIGANGGGSKTLSIMDAMKANAFVKIRPMEYRRDLLAVIMPKY